VVRLAHRKSVGWLLLAGILLEEVGSHFLSEFVYSWAPHLDRLGLTAVAEVLSVERL